MPTLNARTVYVCQHCGSESPKWAGRCPQCAQWNSYVEHRPGPAARSFGASEGGPVQPQELAAVDSSRVQRISLPFREVNRVLGGGIVPGSLTLIGGDPGIGKSTLLLQIAQAVASSDGDVLYISGEESPHQIKLRAQRLGLSGQRLLLLSESNLDHVLGRLDEHRPALAVVDSIQAMYLDDVPSTAGSVAQVRECSLRLMRWAKVSETPVFIAGHVTKDGAIAGPKVLEHMVDVVLYLEGEGFSPYRILRGVKNRFGSTNDVGIFEMRDGGLAEVENPSATFLAHRREAARGSAIVATMEGTRPLLVEIQALVTPTPLAAPRRVANGVDVNRLLLMAAVLTKHLRLGLSSQDVLLNVVGGLRIAEPAADAGIALAVVSSLWDVPLKAGCVVMGEVGLSGELRPVSQVERRLGEAAALGFTSCILPEGSMSWGTGPPGVELLPAATLGDAVRLGLAPGTRGEGAA
ncbi:MAG: DNA repair protein RadA [Dehalococcoidia bacterium]